MEGRSLQWLNVADGKITVIREDEIPKWDARFSPDDEWISFHMPVDDAGELDWHRRRLFIARVEGNSLVPKDQWISISDGQRYEGFSSWAPDGNAIFFWSDRGATATLLKQPLEPQSKVPIGPGEEIVGFRYRRRPIQQSLTPTMTALEDSIILRLPDLTGNIWVMGPGGDPTP